jgi:Domain of unknown function (DUF4369)
MPFPRLISLATLYLLATTAFAQGSFTITGKLDSLTGTHKVFLKKQDNGSSRVLTVATTEAVNGQFSITQTVPEVDYYTVSMEGVGGQVSFILDYDLTIAGTGHDLRTVTVSGSLLTETWQRFQTDVDLPYRKQLMTLYNERQQNTGNTEIATRVETETKRLKIEQIAKVGQLIQSRPYSFFSLFLLNNYANEFSKPEVRTLFDGLSAPLRNHSVAKRLLYYIK